MKLPVNGLGQYGVLSSLDAADEYLPLSAWTAANNVKFENGFIEKFAGEKAVFDALTISPRFLMPVPTTSAYFWVYLGTAKAFATDGTSHFDITRATGGDYSATGANVWTGCVLGGVPICNNFNDDPQMWLPPNGGTDLALLSNWPASTKCRALRAYKNYLIALDVTKAGTRYPQMVKWSHPADPGTVPTSWDHTDPTKEAGEYPTSETAGANVDCAVLGGVNMIYKDDSIWTMQWVGGVSVFRITPLISTFGILARNCVGELPGFRHVVFGQDDIVVFDGRGLQSILDRKYKRALYNAIDTTNYAASFTVVYPAQTSVWFCFPRSGSAFCNAALVWNWKDNTLTFRDLANVAHGAAGIINDSTVVLTWDADTQPWDLDNSIWDADPFNPAALSLLMANASGNKLLQIDQTETFTGVPFTAYVERTGLGYPVKVDAPPDYTNMKYVTKLWPHLIGPTGTAVEISVGSQEVINGPVTWESTETFIIGQDLFVEPMVSARIHTLRVRSTGSQTWRMHGYDVEFVHVGEL